MTKKTMTGPQLKREREKRGLTQEALACIIEVDRSTIAKWETTANPMHQRYVKLIRIELDALDLGQ